ncbi:MAG: hypothetical protein HKP58_08800 [Desulfatitalea sp.]|nr:RepB family DNA primase [Desulfatitalea sp.]NNK00497.1 hypothetical protein [Desulfatitalea sp.]
MKDLNNKLSMYFHGWQRYGTMNDGDINTILPDAIDITMCALDPDEDIFIGPAEDVRSFYSIHDDLSEDDLNDHRSNGNWRPGRFVLQKPDGKYCLWVRYETERQNQHQKNWVQFGTVNECNSSNSIYRVVHCDGENQEKTKNHVTAEKKHGIADSRPSENQKGMEKVFGKLEKFFGEYEIGVFRDSQNDKEAAVWLAEKNIGYLKAMNAQGRHIFIRPTVDKEPYFIMHDDLDEKHLNACHKRDGSFKPGRLVVETSPGNYQVWIKSSRPVDNSEKSHWLRVMRSDPGASPKRRWGRCPGFRNRKDKYEKDGGYPLAKIIWVDWAKQAQIPLIEPAQKPSLEIPPADRTPYKVNSAVLPTRDDYFKGLDAKGKIKESEQDLAYAMALMRRDVPDYEIVDRIANERSDWGSHKGEKNRQAYLTRTLDKAHHYIDNSAYTINIEDRAKNRRRQISVENVPKVDAKAILTEMAKNEAVKFGFDNPDALTITVEKSKLKKKEFQKHRSLGAEFDLESN